MIDYPITNKQLTSLWATYVNDKQLQQDFRFGQFVISRTMPKGLCWPKLYYAGTESYDLLWQHINKSPSKDVRKVF